MISYMINNTLALALNGEKDPSVQSGKGVVRKAMIAHSPLMNTEHQEQA